MFTAIILACFIDGSCVELIDRYGPYKTEVECKVRLVDMMQDFISAPTTPPVKLIKYKCSTKQGTKT